MITTWNVIIAFPDALVVIAWWLVTITLATFVCAAVGAFWYYIREWLFRYNAVYRFALYNALIAWVKKKDNRIVEIRTADGKTHQFKEVRGAV